MTVSPPTAHRRALGGSTAMIDGHGTGVPATDAPVFAALTGGAGCRFEETMEHDGTSLIFGRMVDFVRPGAAAPLIHFHGRPIQA